MPPAKKPANEDSRPEAMTMRERQVAAAAHARKSKNGASAQNNGSSLKDLSLAAATESNKAAEQGQGAGMAWNDAPLELLNSYRVVHNLNTPAAFTSPYHQALLTKPGIGLRSPTMLRKKHQQRQSKEQLALAVRKHFNAAAVNETDVVVDLLYKVKCKDQAFRMRSTPSGVTKKTT